MKTFTIYDRDGQQVAQGEEYEIVGEENKLWRDGDGDGELALHGDQMRAGDEREFVWHVTSGEQITIGSIVCE